MQLPDNHAAGPSNLVGRPLMEVERYYIEQALKLTDGNREEAARMLGISTKTLYNKLRLYGSAPSTGFAPSYLARSDAGAIDGRQRH